VESRADRPRTSIRVPRSTGPPPRARDHLPGGLPTGPRRPVPGSAQGTAHRPAAPQATPSCRCPPRSPGQHDDDRPAAAGGDRPRGCRALGRRSHHGRVQPLRDWHLGGAHEPVRAPSIPARPAHRRGGPRRRHRRDEGSAGASTSITDLGSGQRDGVARRDRPGSGHAGVLLREGPARGSVPATRTPTGCYASTSRRGPTCAATTPSSSPPSPTSSTPDRARPFPGRHPPHCWPPPPSAPVPARATSRRGTRTHRAPGSADTDNA
jgi:hypothetical protein